MLIYSILFNILLSLESDILLCFGMVLRQILRHMKPIPKRMAGQVHTLFIFARISLCEILLSHCLQQNCPPDSQPVAVQVVDQCPTCTPTQARMLWKFVSAVDSRGSASPFSPYIA